MSTLARVTAAVAAGLLLGGLLGPVAALGSSSDTWTAGGDGHTWTDGSNWSAGVPQDGDSVTIAPTKTQSSPDVTDLPSDTSLQDLTLTDSSLSGGSLTVTGSFSWSESTSKQNVLDAPLTVTGSASISGPGKKITFDHLTFEGDTDVSGSGLFETEFSGAAITNSGRFTIEPGAAVQADACCVTPNEFINTGTVATPSSAGGTATLGWMDFNDQGSIQIGQGSELLVTVGPMEFSPGAGIGGRGTLTFDQGAAVKLANGVSIATGTTVRLTGNALLNGSGGFTGKGTFWWTGGSIMGNLEVAKTVATSVSGTAFKQLDAPASKEINLTLDGPTTVSDTGPIDIHGGSITNSGTFTMRPGTAVQAGACCVSPDHFTNKGTLVIAAGKRSAAFRYLAFVNQGTVRITSGKMAINVLGYDQPAGSTILAGGSLSPVTVNIAGGTLTGHGKITGSVVNAGTVSPASTGGPLTIAGAYQQLKKGVFATAVSSTGFGQLVVTGAATLAGTLKAAAGGHFKPKHGQSFQVMRYKARTGKFTTISGKPTYRVSYPGSVKITY